MSVLISCMAVVAIPYTLASLKCRRGARRVFTDRGGGCAIPPTRKTPPRLLWAATISIPEPQTRAGTYSIGILNFRIYRTRFAFFPLAIPCFCAERFVATDRPSCRIELDSRSIPLTTVIPTQTKIQRTHFLRCLLLYAPPPLIKRPFHHETVLPSIF